MTQKIGIIAGNGRFPFLVLDAARALGYAVTIIATTRGTTVIRMAFTHSSPSGEIHRTAEISVSLPEAATSAPAARPATSDETTRVVREMVA